MNKNSIIKKYLDQYPNMKNMTLAKKIYNENKLHFKDIEAVRNSIRYYRGSLGKDNLKTISNEKYLTSEKLNEKYNIPDGIETPYELYKIRKDNTLIFGDVHFMFHVKDTIYRMFDYGIKQPLDSIVILGDLLDLYQESDFMREPSISLFQQERETAKLFLKELKRVFPKCEIYYKFGNHEKRFENYMMHKAPEIYGVEEFRLEILLDLFNIGVHYIPEDIIIDMGGGLYAGHGHETKGGIIAPVVPSRTALLKAKESIIVAHHHKTDSVTMNTVSGKVIGGWSIGCMCNLHPKYRPQNDWTNGFAVRIREDEDFWHVQNKTIIKGRVI